MKKRFMVIVITLLALGGCAHTGAVAQSAANTATKVAVLRAVFH